MGETLVCTALVSRTFRQWLSRVVNAEAMFLGRVEECDHSPWWAHPMRLCQVMRRRDPIVSVNNDSWWRCPALLINTQRTFGEYQQKNRSKSDLLHKGWTNGQKWAENRLCYDRITTRNPSEVGKKCESITLISGHVIHLRCDGDPFVLHWCC
jgi:hypothetical protein